MVLKHRTALTETTFLGGRMAKSKFRTLPALTARDIARFWKKVARCSASECWLWTAGKTPAGYGHFGLCRSGKDETYYAHRVSYFIEHGVDPGSFHVCHTCDQPSCVNPAHLWLGTDASNMQDASRKGRVLTGDNHPYRKHPELIPRGEVRGHAKLKNADVIEIRKLYESGWLQRELAAKFAVSLSRISYIVTRRHWSHLP